jgi:hypothetical protein
MNNSPGWASPGSVPSDPGESVTPEQSEKPRQPGVIPLRPLAVGEIFAGTLSTIRLHWRAVLSISFVVALLIQAVSMLATGLFFKHTSSFMGNAVSLGISVVGQLFATAMLTIIISRSVIGRSVSAGEAWRDSSPRLLQLLGMTLVVCLLTMIVVVIGAGPGILLAVSGSAAGGATLTMLGGLVGIIVAVWLVVCLSLTTPTLMLEKQGVFASLARSAKLVRGAWWRIFGIQLLATIIVFIVTSVIAIPFTAIGMVLGSNGTQTLLANGSTLMSWPFLVITGIGTMIGATFTFPVSAGVTTLLYMDQRIRREGLDIELAHAAGVPGY